MSEIPFWLWFFMFYIAINLLFLLVFYEHLLKKLIETDIDSSVRQGQRRGASTNTSGETQITILLSLLRCYWALDEGFPLRVPTSTKRLDCGRIPKYTANFPVYKFNSATQNVFSNCEQFLKHRLRQYPEHTTGIWLSVVAL